MHASAASPFGVIDFVENHPSLLQSAVAGGVVGGPPAYLEAHGIRYVPCDQPLDSVLVPMSSGDTCGGAGSLESAAAIPSQVSPRELNSRVDSRIRRFMAAQQSPTSMRAAYGREEPEDGGVNERLRNLRRECEVASRGAGHSLEAEATSSRLRKLRENAESVGNVGARAKRNYDF
jgi:hypothetical protein